MSDARIAFRRIRGRIVPIKISGETVAKGIGVGLAAAGAKAAANKYDKIGNQKSIRVRPVLDMLGLGLAVTSGVVAAKTFVGPLKQVAFGIGASLGLDVLSSIATALSVAGKGKIEKRVRQAAKIEARNVLAGNLVFGAGLLASAANRAKAASALRSAARVVFRR